MAELKAALQEAYKAILANDDKYGTDWHVTNTRKITLVWDDNKEDDEDEDNDEDTTANDNDNNKQDRGFKPLR